MAQGLERLFWLVGGILILPFLLHQGIALSDTESAKNRAPELGFLSSASPTSAVANARTVAPAEARGQSAGLGLICRAFYVADHTPQRCVASAPEVPQPNAVRAHSTMDGEQHKTLNF